jgi:HlyD family secretion protein
MKSNPMRLIVKLAAELGRRIAALAETTRAKTADGRTEELSRFRSDISALDAEPPPKAAKAVVACIFSAVVLSIAWASFARMDKVVVSEGRLITASSRIAVQPQETGTVRTLDVRIGQVLRKGDLIATLDSTVADSDARAGRSTLGSLEAQTARLEAELSDRRPASFSPDPVENAIQTEIADRKKAEIDAALAALDAEIGALAAELRSNAAERSSAAKAAAITKEVESMRETLLARDAGSRLQLLEAKARNSEAERELSRLINGSSQISQRLAAAKERRAAHREEARSKTGQELQNARRERDKAKEDLFKQERRGELVSLLAPTDGIVLEVAQKGPGSIAGPTDPIVTLVPIDSALEAEVEILPRDVALLRSGDAVRLKLDSLPWQAHGTLSGRLLVIGADVVKTDKGGPQGQGIQAYKARIAIERGKGETQASALGIRVVPDDFRLIPGMGVSAEIRTGTRRVISYFIHPVMRSIDESFREP